MVPVSAHRLVLLSCVGIAWASSCAVFPDGAVLPSDDTMQLGGSGGGGAGGGADGEHAGAGGSDAPLGGRAGSESTGGGAGTSTEMGGAGGLIEPPAGAAGAAGGPASCAQPRVRSIPIGTDTWIEAAKPAMSHPNDKELFVVGGVAERRALLSLSLPAAEAGETLVVASLELQLQSNADATGMERRLAVHALERDFVEARTTWQNFSNGPDGEWDTEGGDLGPRLAAATLPARTSSGTVKFDVTVALAAALSSQAVPLSLIVLEISAAPGSPAELAFVSSEGDDSKRPHVVLDSCLP